MDEETKKAIDAIKAQLFTLRTLLVSHILATSEADPALVIATVKTAESQIDAAVQSGMGREALALKMLLEALTDLTGPLAAND